MGCNCGGKRAGIRYQVSPTDGTPPKKVDTVDEAQKIVREHGGTFKAVAA
jgi:hypothetical protein